MKLPSCFLDKMNRLLGDDEFNELLESYNQPRHFGIRINTLKISVGDFLRLTPI